jgi:hypothetical protein
MKTKFNPIQHLGSPKLLNFAFILAIVFISIMQTGCVVYVPNVINTPLLSNKGDVQANLNFGESGFDPQLSAAVSDHVGIMLNGSFRLNADNSVYGEVHNFVEAGAGYYTQFENVGRFEVYGGAGFGNLKATYTGDLFSQPNLDVHTFRLFLQPDVGVKTRYFDGSFASRLVWLNLDMGNETNTNFFIEPAITLKGGAKNVKAVLQFGYSIQTSYIDNFYDPVLFSIGIQGTFGGKNAQTKKQPTP